MQPYCLAKFLDNGVFKIVNTKLLRYELSGKPYAPITCDDLPELDVEAKWEQSFHKKGPAESDSADFDGYFPVKILAIASKYIEADSDGHLNHQPQPLWSVCALLFCTGSLQSAYEKAASMKIKLPPDAVLDSPYKAKQHEKPEESNSSNSRAVSLKVNM